MSGLKHDLEAYTGQARRQAGRQAGRQANGQAPIWIDMERQCTSEADNKDRHETDIKTDRQAGRQMARHSTRWNNL